MMKILTGAVFLGVIYTILISCNDNEQVVLNEKYGDLVALKVKIDGIEEIQPSLAGTKGESVTTFREAIGDGVVLETSITAEGGYLLNFLSDPSKIFFSLLEELLLQDMRRAVTGISCYRMAQHC